MKLSIITINYNNASGLQKTMESVFNQTSNDFEYIVVDGTTSPPTPLLEERGVLFPNAPKGGVSRDREVIEFFIKETHDTENGFTRCTWFSPSADGGVGGGFFSEPDSGIYNAMNKGIRLAKGEYVHFLNSGDWLVDEKVVENMLKHLTNQEPRTKNQEPATKNQESKEVDILIGDVISIRPDGKKRYDKNSKNVSLYTFYGGTIQHTSAYIRRTLFEKYGYYDETLKIVSDWKWYLTVVVFNGAVVSFADLFVTCFDRTGISSTQLDLDKAERRRVLEELIPATILSDYDRFHFTIDQMERIKKHFWLYRIFWFAERVYFKIDKWNAKYWGWKS